MQNIGSGRAQRREGGERERERLRQPVTAAASEHSLIIRAISLLIK
jgi:hypothetical protein